MNIRRCFQSRNDVQSVQQQSGLSVLNAHASTDPVVPSPHKSASSLQFCLPLYRCVVVFLFFFFAKFFPHFRFTRPCNPLQLFCLHLAEDVFWVCAQCFPGFWDYWSEMGSIFRCAHCDFSRNFILLLSQRRVGNPPKARHINPIGVDISHGICLPGE